MPTPPRWGPALLLVLSALVAPAAAQAPAAGAPSCASPQQAARSLLDWQQPGQTDLKAAASCLDLPPGADGHVLARQLKQVLDARGLYVPVDALSLDPDHRDASGGHRAVPISTFPLLVLEKHGDRWLWGRGLLEATPALHRQTFTGLPGRLQRALPRSMDVELLGVHTWQLVYALGLMCVALAAGVAAQRLIAEQALRAATRAGLGLSGAALQRTRAPLMWCVAGAVLYAGVPDLQLDVLSSRALRVLASALTSFAAVLIAVRAVDALAEAFARKAAATPSRADDQAIPLLSRAAKSAIWALGAVFVAQNLGVDVGSLLAGLGIGGLAIALAARDTLENLFGSLTIFTDRPFQVGDWVVIGGGEAEGVVEEVGFRSTRIRTFHNSLISVPNGKVAVSTVDNLGKRRVRRVKTTLGLTYDTPPERLRAFCAALRARLGAHPAVAEAPLEVHFSGFGDSALEVMVYFFLDVPTWSAELDTRAALYLGFLDDAAATGVRFAFPSRSLYLETPVGISPDPAAPPAPAAC